MPATRQIFISYARKDGEDFARDLSQRLAEENLDLPQWRDREQMEGGRGWWKQIEKAIDSSKFLVLVMTPAALISETTRKEWHYARQQGVVVYPVKGVPDSQLDYAALPAWMSKSHFFDLTCEWETFVSYLRRDREVPRVPFMAPDMPEGFIQRSIQHDELLGLLLDKNRENPVAITTALQGAGGYGKTTLATMLCHDDQIIDAFDDGILWVTLGEDADQSTVLRELGKLYYAITREQPGFVDASQASIELAQKLENLNCLLVIDDVWKAELLEPFLRGGKGCARLITTRLFPVAHASGGQSVNVDEMTPDESARMLLQKVPESERPTDLTLFSQLARRLGECPLLLKLASGALRSKLDRSEDLAGALTYINCALDKRSIFAFDNKNSAQRDAAVANTIELSTELLDAGDLTRFLELAIFPEDTPIPLTTLESLWSLDELDTEDTAQRLADHSLLDLDLKQGAISLHDVMRAYIASRLLNPTEGHGRLVSAWGDFLRLPDDYAWRWAIYHLSKAGWITEIQRLLFDFDWLLAKLEATNANALVTDFDFLPNDPNTRLLQRAIQLSAHVLGRDTRQLASQLTGRLLGIQTPEIQALVARISEWRGAHWMRPLHPNLSPPGGALLRVLEGHSDCVSAVAMMPDGRHVISGSWDKTLRIWDLESGKSPLTLEGHSNWVTAVAVTPDGRRAVSASLDKTLRVWDLESGKTLLCFEGHSDKVTAVAITPDGRHAISGSADKTLRVWDLESGKTLLCFEGHSDSETSMAVEWRAICGPPNSPHIGDLEKSEIESEFFGVRAVAMIPNGRRAISASFDSLRVWDLDSGKSLLCLEWDFLAVHTVSVTPDGRHAIYSSLDDALCVWDLESGKILLILEGHSKPVMAVAVTMDGRRAISASGDKTLRVWDLENGKSLLTLDGHYQAVMAVAVTPDGRHAISGSWDNTLRLWDLECGKGLLSPEGHSDCVYAVAMMPDGRHIISGSSDKTLRIWDLESGKSLLTLEGHSNCVSTVAVTPDGRHAISGSADKTLRVWDLESGRSIISLEGHSDVVTAVAVTLDGKYVVSGSIDKTLRIWDLESGKSLLTLKGHSNFVSTVAVTPDGRQAISGSWDKTLRIWDLESGKSLLTLEGHSSCVSAVAVTPDGQRAVSASWDNTLRVWDLESGRTLLCIEGCSSAVNAVAVTPDGRHAVSGSADKTLRIWDLESGNLFHTMWADASVKCCAIALGGNLFVAGDESGRVHILRFVEARQEPNLKSVAKTLFLLRSFPTSSGMQSNATSDIHDVFLAHNSLDKPAVLAISKALKQRGLRPWVDVDEIPPGRWFQEFLQAAITKVKSAAIFIGPQGLGRWQAVELLAFVSQCVERKIPVIPVLLPGVNEIPPQLIFLRELNAVKFHSSVDEEGALERLVWGITGIKPDMLPAINQTPTAGANPTSEAARELLKLILEHPVRDERGLFEISKNIIPLYTSFIPNLTCAGGAPSFKTRVFKAAVDELIQLGWLLPPEPVLSHGGIAYELNPDLNS